MRTTEATEHRLLVPDIDQARRHLSALDPAAEKFVFQAFDDSKEKNPKLACVISGSLDQHAKKLIELNRKGAGIFVTVNKSSNGSRKKRDIVGFWCQGKHCKAWPAC